MSGHNPHSHLSQPNSSWNPLQIPSYIPRQPQLAHMSNERPVVRSPLTWHTPTPPEALYSFISANHKNLEINPLLPSFVRGPPPFGSVDLTIQSARNSTTPSPRNLTSPPPEFSHNKQISRSLTPNSLSNLNITPSPGVIQTTGSVRDKFQNVNGNSGEIQTTGNLFVRDARQINNDIVKMTREPLEVNITKMTTVSSEPVELVKDITYHPIKSHAVPTSPKRLSPTRPLSVPNNRPISPHSQSPLPSLSNTGSATDIVNNMHNIPQLSSMSLQQKSAPEIIMKDNSPICSTIPSPSNITSNEDSVDSNTSKTRRKRKPNKTSRMSNDSDDSQPATKTEICITKPINEVQNEIADKISDSLLPPPICEKSKNIQTIKDAQQKKDIKSVSLEKAPETTEQHTSELNKISENIDNRPSKEKESTIQDESHRVIVNNTSTSSTELGSHELLDQSMVNKNNPHNRPNKLEKIEEQKQKTNEITSNHLESPRKRTKRKGDSDDIETIDKIAAMIANSCNDELIESENTINNVIDNFQTPNEKLEAQSNSSKIHELTEILLTPVDNNTTTETTATLQEISKHDPLDVVKDNCFEEVENKLEEMFAGIEDETPRIPSQMPGTSDEQGTNEITSVLGLEMAITDKNEEIFEEQKTINTSQKRTHSNSKLTEQIPPKKKRKVAKKSNSGQKTMKSSSKFTSNHNKTNSKTEKTKDKIKEEIIPDIKYKVPFVQVKIDGSMNVINAPIAEDDVEKQNKVKKIIHNHHTNSDRNKIRGLHISTLSTKYDADTADATWMCVFCKKGPHKLGLGDLFGPYIITTTCEEFQLSQNDPNDDEFISKRVKSEMFQKHPNGIPIVPASSSNVNLGISTKKKRKSNESPSTIAKSQSNFNLKDIYVGMSQATETSYEVWMHEDCAVWSSGVHIIGARIVGLEAAVWSSTRYKCSICLLNGAMICCLQRNCPDKAHIPCARSKNWCLSEDDFKSLCENHSSTSSSSSSMSTLS